MSRQWDDFQPPLLPALREAVGEFGFAMATPVQAAAIPQLLSHKDVVVEAVTGSGKTLAFLLPVMQILGDAKRASPCLRDRRRIGAIVLSPTRELATQIHETLGRLLARGAWPLTSLLLIGGVAGTLEEDLERHRRDGGNIVVATPGRLEEFLRRFGGEIGPGLRESFEVLVLDEADRLLDLGFEASIRAILSQLPKQRRTGLFSATMTEAIGNLIRTGLRNPVRVTVEVGGGESGAGVASRVPNELSLHHHIVASFEEKVLVLANLVFAPEGELRGKKTIIYFATCACVDFYAQVLKMVGGEGDVGGERDVGGEGDAPTTTTTATATTTATTTITTTTHMPSPALFALHGKLSHQKRTTVYRRFSETPGSAVLLCTDLAARGLDFPDVDWVVQFDPPQDPKSFLHRCGRTARNGRTGDALVLLLPNEEAYLDLLRNRGIQCDHALPNPRRPVFDDSLLTRFKEQALSDRDVYEAGIRAFVSYIRFYQEHQARFIFQLKSLDIPSLARSFALLRLPSMPELRGVFSPAGLVGFVATEHDADAIPFRERERETQRQRNLAKKRKETADRRLQEDAAKKRRVKNAPWSEKAAQKKMRAERKEKKTRRAEYLRKAAAGESARDAKDAVPAPCDSDYDLDEMEADYRELKRERRNRNGK